VLAALQSHDVIGGPLQVPVLHVAFSPYVVLPLSCEARPPAATTVMLSAATVGGSEFAVPTSEQPAIV